MGDFRATGGCLAGAKGRLLRVLLRSHQIGDDSFAECVEADGKPGIIQQIEHLIDKLVLPWSSRNGVLFSRS
jgi:hypothetical protein